MLDHNGNPDTQWWNSGKAEAAYIDFTKPEVAQWFTDHLKQLQTSAGIDSYKFDAGETSWSPPVSRYSFFLIFLINLLNIIKGSCFKKRC